MRRLLPANLPLLHYNFKAPNFLYRNAAYSCMVKDAPEITVLQLPKFKAEATKLIGEDGIEALAVYLIDHRAAGDVIPGSGGIRKLRWAAQKQRKARRRPDHLPVRCDCGQHLPDSVLRQNVKTDLTADEKKQLRQIAAHLKGAQ